MATGIGKIERIGRKLMAKIIGLLFSTDTFERIPADERIERILVLRHDKIGDMVISLPAIRMLRNALPKAEIAVLASRHNSIILANESGIRIIYYEKAPWKFMASLFRCRRYRPDVVIDMLIKESTTSALYAAFCGARWRIHAKTDRKNNFNILVEIPRESHIVDATRKLVAVLIESNISIERDDNHPVSLSSEELAFGARFWKNLTIDPRKYIAVNISAGTKSRFWGEAKFAQICRFILKMDKIPIIFFAPDDKSSARLICDSAPGALLCTDTPTILHAAAVLKDTKMLISPDTSIVHIAAGFGMPVLMFCPAGTDNRTRWAPYAVHTKVIQSSNPKTIASIEPENLYDAIEEMLRGGDK